LAGKGLDFTHEFAGVEPTVRRFNDLTMLTEARLYNPCVNARAMLTTGIDASGSPDLNVRKITQQIMNPCPKLCGQSTEVLLNKETKISKRDTADASFATAHLLRS